MLQVLERERIKREALLAERQIFEGRVQLRELKRRAGERDGDEELLIGKREKRRRPDDFSVSNGYVSLSKLVLGLY